MQAEYESIISCMAFILQNKYRFDSIDGALTIHNKKFELTWNSFETDLVVEIVSGAIINTVFDSHDEIKKLIKEAQMNNPKEHIVCWAHNTIERITYPSKEIIYLTTEDEKQSRNIFGEFYNRIYY